MTATAMLVVATCVYMQATPICTPVDNLPLQDMELCGMVSSLVTRHTPSGVLAYCVPLMAAQLKIEKPK